MTPLASLNLLCELQAQRIRQRLALMYSRGGETVTRPRPLKRYTRPDPKPAPPCKYEGCFRISVGHRRMCRYHYAAYRRHQRKAVRHAA